jgi:hypothetical protein
MAINPSIRYSGRTDTSDPAYPRGKARNVAVVGDGTGTPWEKDLVNDLFGFQQALLGAALIVPSGTPDKVGASQYLDAVELAAEGAHAVFSVTHPAFGADPTGGVDCAAAFNAANGAAAALGGRLFIPPGSFKTTTPLVTTPGVTWEGVSGKSFVYINHATNNLLRLSAGVGGQGVVFRNLGFGAAIANTGKLIVNLAGNDDFSALFDNCEIGNSFHTGQLLAVEAGSRVTLRDCSLLPNCTTQALILSHASGELHLAGGRIVCPATYANSLVYFSLGGGSVHGVDFDFTSHASGVDPTGVDISSTSRPISVVGNVFRGTGGPTKFGLKWDSDVKLTEGRNAFDGVNRFRTNGLLADGSSIEEHPSVNVGVVGNAYTISNGVASTLIRFGATSTDPTITLPLIYYRGQRITIAVYNASGGPFAGVTMSGGLPTGFGSVLNGGIKTLVFEALDYDLSGTPEWVCISERG